MVQKVVANNGLFRIPLDVFDFEGPNGEHELTMGLTTNNFITLHFPNADHINPPLPVPQLIPVQNSVPQPAPKNYVFTFTKNVA